MSVEEKRGEGKRMNPNQPHPPPYSEVPKTPSKNRPSSPLSFSSSSSSSLATTPFITPVSTPIAASSPSSSHSHSHSHSYPHPHPHSHSHPLSQTHRSEPEETPPQSSSSPESDSEECCQPPHLLFQNEEFEEEEEEEDFVASGDPERNPIELSELYWRGDRKYKGTDSVSPKGFPRCLPFTCYERILPLSAASVSSFAPSAAYSPSSYHPGESSSSNSPLCRIMFLMTFANVTAVETSEGLVLIDVGHDTFGRAIKRRIRKFSDKPVHSVIYTHGHLDHVMGIFHFEEIEKINVIAHQNLPKRFDRYKMTLGYNAHINNKQFGANSPWPSNYRYPDTCYNESLELYVGGVRFEINHGRGETDDASWVWIPEARVLCTGDFFIWASPNCGNPQKAQRYPIEWAATLRKMAALRPIFLFPGHGPAIIGEKRIQQALIETASFLEAISQHTLDGINKGKRLSEIVRTLKIPPYFLKRPYLQPVYDDPVFIVHNIWRQYAGWWDQNPAHLHVGNQKEIAEEVVRLAGSVERLADKAFDLAKEGKYDAASSLIEWASEVNPKSRYVHHRRSFIYNKRAEAESSLMAKGIYKSAQLESEKELRSTTYLLSRLEGISIRAAEKSGLFYEGAVMRRKVLDFKERVEDKVTEILTALKVLSVIAFILQILAALPVVGRAKKAKEKSLS